MSSAPTSIPDRRRSPRVAVRQGSWLASPATWSVQLVDLSMGGVAFTSSHQLDLGRTAALRTSLGQDAFSGQVRVTWSRRRGPAVPMSQHFEIGATFLPMEESSRRALQAFLKLSVV